jgi:hypothetical protein
MTRVRARQLMPRARVLQARVQRLSHGCVALLATNQQRARAGNAAPAVTRVARCRRLPVVAAKWRSSFGVAACRALCLSGVGVGFGVDADSF